MGSLKLPKELAGKRFKLSLGMRSPILCSQCGFNTAMLVVPLFPLYIAFAIIILPGLLPYFLDPKVFIKLMYEQEWLILLVTVIVLTFAFSSHSHEGKSPAYPADITEELNQKGKEVFIYKYEKRIYLI